MWHYPEWRHWSQEHGRYYYVDPETKETTWDLPDKHAWEDLVDEDSEKTYALLSLSLSLDRSIGCARP